MFCFNFWLFHCRDLEFWLIVTGVSHGNALVTYNVNRYHYSSSCMQKHTTEKHNQMGYHTVCPIFSISINSISSLAASCCYEGSKRQLSVPSILFKVNSKLRLSLILNSKHVLQHFQIVDFLSDAFWCMDIFQLVCHRKIVTALHFKTWFSFFMSPQKKRRR
jgi:hypothetical protein